MFTEPPKIGDKIEYFKNNVWTYAGTVALVAGNICYIHNENLPEDAARKFFGGTPPKNFPNVNNSFIWKFGENTNSLHRIVK